MTTGVYRHDDGREERFICGPSAQGWEYAASLWSHGVVVGTVDVLCHRAGRQARVSVTGPEWSLRGGVVGNEAVWCRQPRDPQASVEQAAEEAVVAAGFTGSPGLVVALAGSLSDGEPVALRVVRIAPDAAGVLVADEAWSSVVVDVHETDLGPLPVREVTIDDLATGARTVVHLAGDVVLAGGGVDLADLQGPPTLG